ncbi:MAG: hypothetical protein NT006_09045 [Candidatus Aminicenantes bacterium]|nr:hypothetical protein [Candidatus Aminicenantes bacterium]
MDYRGLFDSRNLKHYLEDIAKFPALTEAEEKKLGERIRQGDEEALQTLIHALTLSSRIFTVPQKLADQISQMKKKTAELKAELGRDPTREEVAKSMGISGTDVEDLELLGDLDEKEALVLKLRFGLEDDRPLTLQEIGDQLKLTRERIRQIEQKAMRKLSRSQKLQGLRGYLN